MLAPRGISYALYRCTHLPCPMLIEEAAIGSTPLSYFPASSEDTRLKA